jgi:hypothetical protein
MPALDTIDRIGRLQQRIRELEEGKEIDAKHINLLLGDKGTKAFDAEWKRQQGLRKVKKPAGLNNYATLHKQVTALLARCEAGGTKTKVEQASTYKLQSKCQTAIGKAHAAIVSVIAKNGTLADWLDRAAPSTLPTITLTDSDKAAIKDNNELLDDLYEQLPILVSSKNERRRVSIEERFGWKTKRGIRLDLLRQTLDEANDNALKDLEKEMYRREVKAARVFMDAFCKARDEGKNAYSEANIALQRAGFPRTDNLVSRTMSKRDREIREMEEALLKRFEAEMTEEEREQLAMSREFDKQAGKRGK